MTEEFVKQFDIWVDDYFKQSEQNKNYVEILSKSMYYSLKSGGKRFRPYLAFSLFKIWNSHVDQIKNICLAIEMIHTYSLIHDDLPCMDNDDYRRGQLTNHKVFGEDIALLAGDSLLTEAFQLISNCENLKVEVRLKLIQLLASKIGVFGMVGGQVLDMKADKKINHKELQKVHTLKTAYLIQFAALAGALCASATEAEIQFVSEFGLSLGLAFQIKDDLLDMTEQQQDFKNYVSVLGLKETQIELHEQTQIAQKSLTQLQKKSAALDDLFHLTEMNLTRTV